MTTSGVLNVEQGCEEPECHPDHQNASHVPQSTEEVDWERMCERGDELQAVDNDDKAFPCPMPHNYPDRDDLRCHCLASGVGDLPPIAFG